MWPSARFLEAVCSWRSLYCTEKTKTSVRPLACGDPIRRLVAKCFCVGGKGAISKAFDGKNYGVGCKGGVEVVAHSLRDTLANHKGSKLGMQDRLQECLQHGKQGSFHETSARNVPLHV